MTGGAIGLLLAIVLGAFVSGFVAARWIDAARRRRYAASGFLKLRRPIIVPVRAPFHAKDFE